MFLDFLYVEVLVEYLDKREPTYRPAPVRQRSDDYSMNAKMAIARLVAVKWKHMGKMQMPESPEEW